MLMFNMLKHACGLNSLLITKFTLNKKNTHHSPSISFTTLPQGFSEIENSPGFFRFNQLEPAPFHLSSPNSQGLFQPAAEA